MDTTKPATARAPGRPKGSTGDVYHQLAQERVRHEKAKADACELANRLREGELLERKDVETASARLHAALAQFLRGLPDVLERKCSLPPSAVEELEAAIDAATAELGERIKRVLG
ncbi:MAG: hypothetical protein Q8M09_05960 [Pseudomonadota bacterium]|nr:hypothetical protein [Pseudomonadota bacterium]MDP1903775.1 hypothetical protein [Pseudomonadota bacterium]MDP2353716.1 hypothetical protein [Pseudomonadota bacterium]